MKRIITCCIFRLCCCCRRPCKKLIVCIALLLPGRFVFAQKHTTLPDTITRYFNEIKQAAGKKTQLWGLSLYGPLLLVNPVTRALYANAADRTGLLQYAGKIYTGQLPPSVNIANTSLTWGGRQWAMVMLPLPADKYDRINLLAHELFHNAQATLGFRLLNTDNNHLDKKEGRVYLRLELEALKKAIAATTTADEKLYLSDALRFRIHRYGIYPGADSSENTLELNEGLAEYTGYVVSNRNRQQSLTHFNQELSRFFSNPTFVRSFAYQTIPLYGYLLHRTKKYWNKEIRPNTSLAHYFMRAFAMPVDSSSSKNVNDCLTRYKGKQIDDEETARAVTMEKKVAAYKIKFIKQPHVTIVFEQMSVSFDPRNIMPVEDAGTFYPAIRVSDKWGVLTVTDGALMSPDWSSISIGLPVNPAGKNISGDGWTLVLADNYTLVKDTSSGNYILAKK